MMIWLSTASYTGVPTTKTTGWMLNEGTLTQPFRLQGDSSEEELTICRRYFEKSWATETPVGTLTYAGGVVIGYPAPTSSTANDLVNSVYYRVDKRVIPTVTQYSPTAAGTGILLLLTVTANGLNSSKATSTLDASIKGYTNYTVNLDSGTGGIVLQWTADAEL